MSWYDGLHLAISAAIFVIVFVESIDEPFWLRTLTAGLLALLWLPALILFMLIGLASFIRDILRVPE